MTECLFWTGRLWLLFLIRLEITAKKRFHGISMWKLVLLWWSKKIFLVLNFNFFFLMPWTFFVAELKEKIAGGIIRNLIIQGSYLNPYKIPREIYIILQCLPPIEMHKDY